MNADKETMKRNILMMLRSKRDYNSIELEYHEHTIIPEKVNKEVVHQEVEEVIDEVIKLVSGM